MKALYITTKRLYALWYAARSCGDLYRVEPRGQLTLSEEDHFESYTVTEGRVVSVLRRDVVLTAKERRRIRIMWESADRRVLRR